ncbi:hypothetical protein FGSG_12223 [Fusarium graminearum PH-1]|uniref:hypothetical protein n=1 Tax=Gibberella zeae (strain ATCC MYA-4620 / CBS 123657 / FGSC 9075 / NRRL 31084 / PH-1) TaxID=229533 RepID=UPI00021F254A|nr:hypothetical protein FGSG_12223 [Fusarium graminearum PH-1]ESU08488.1 hypothetical protein FGSG_12223 [Fusarium graminearum PH-1]|eukprot:XP_011320987.1 hypothetical protein FGSG_12223 [Fusarium graminearum PH-1]
MGSLLAKTVDITKLSEVQQLFDDISSKFVKLDILINNAAIMDRFEPVGDVDPELWDRVLAVNLTAPLLLSKVGIHGKQARLDRSHQEYRGLLRDQGYSV